MSIPPTALSKIVANYKHAVQEVRTHARWLREEIDSAERRPSGAHTAGRLTNTAGCLDAAREKANALRQTLEALGAYDPRFDEEKAA